MITGQYLNIFIAFGLARS